MYVARSCRLVPALVTAALALILAISLVADTSAANNNNNPDTPSTAYSNSNNRKDANECSGATVECDELFFIWLEPDHDPHTVTVEEVQRSAFGYMDFKALCAIEAAVSAASASNSRVWHSAT